MPAIIPLPQKKVEIISPPKVTSGTGRVFFQEGFEDNVLKFDGSGVQIVNTAQLVRTGAYCLDIPSKGSANYEITSSCKAIGISPEFFDTNIGVEMFLNFSQVTTAAQGMTSFHVQLDVRDGSTQHLAGIRILCGATGADAKLQYYNSAGSWADVDGGSAPLNAGYYYRLKFTFNPVTQKYGSLEWASSKYDLSAISYKTAVSALELGILYLQNDGVDATVCHTYVDDIMLTTYEV